MWRRRARDSAGCALERAPHVYFHVREPPKCCTRRRPDRSVVGRAGARRPCAGVAVVRGGAVNERRLYLNTMQVFFSGIRTQYAPTPPARDPIPGTIRRRVGRAP